MQDVISKDLVMDQSRTRRLVVEIGYYEKYRYAQLQNRELKAELVRVSSTFVIVRKSRERKKSFISAQSYSPFS